MQNSIVELLEEKLIYSLKDSENVDYEVKKYFFINYGLNNPEYADYS